MEERRRFLKTALGFFSAIGLLLHPVFSLIRHVCAEGKRIPLPNDTKMESLVNKNPQSLDTRNLETTPISEFETMGISDYEVDLDRWRLRITGRVGDPRELTYADILSLPSIDRKVLLICPGFFALNGHWKGISMEDLLEKVGADKGATHITFAGPEGRYEMVDRFPMEEILPGKVFLAYDVNGKPLPRKHGFPLRVVAEDYYGSHWVKYVYKMTVERI
jgi:sulfoxide reductase catalytic subunit YedY